MNRLAGRPDRSAGGSRWFAMICLCVLSVGVARGQAGASDLWAPLRGGKLVVWILSSDNDPYPLPRTTLKAAQTGPPQYQEQTAGSFGQTAGSVGQTAGSTGQTMGNFGQTAGSVGQTAGNTGQTAGSFGKPLPSRNAGDAGTTMGNFGVSTTDLAKAAATANSLTLPGHTPTRYPPWDDIVAEVHRNLPQLDVTFVDVYKNDLAAMLEAAAGTVNGPDVLLARPLPAEWARPETGQAERFGVTMLWTALRVAQIEEVTPRVIFDPQAAIVTSGQNPDVARAFAVWFADRGGLTTGFGPAPKLGSPGAVAISAVRGMLNGGSVGVDTDPEFARFDAPIVAANLKGSRHDDLGPLELRADVMDERVFGSLAVVAVQAIGSGQRAFGVAHALVILRQDTTGRWRVLHISPNLAPEWQARAWSLLVNFCAGTALTVEQGSAVLRNEGTRVLGVSQAAPADGDTRSPQPELWWDNLGGATLQVVEWQRGTGGWVASNLYFVPDTNSRLRTRVTARFATNGQYRWRIWSVGKGGAIVISPWRTLNIAAR